MFENNTPSSLMPANFQAFDGAEKLVEDGAAFQCLVINASSRLQIETVDFLVRRCEERVKLIASLICSVEYSDALDTIGDFVTVARVDYTTEASRLAAIGSQFALELAERARDDASLTLENIAARTIV